MNATGGWTSIDEELDPDSTNPVQNKTLYNLETYHTLTSLGSGAFRIDNGLKVKKGTSVKLFFEDDCKHIAGSPTLGIIPSEYGSARRVKTTIDTFFKKSVGGPYGSEGEVLNNRTINVLSFHNALKGFDDEGNAEYASIYFTKNTAVELIYNDDYWIIIGDLIVGRYHFMYEYFTAPNWNVFAKAVVYASGLKIQWRSFTHHSASGDKYATQETYFPVKFNQTPSMSFSYNDTDNNVARNDIPYAVDNKKWFLNSDYEKNNGTWMAIGY